MGAKRPKPEWAAGCGCSLCHRRCGYTLERRYRDTRRALTLRHLAFEMIDVMDEENDEPPVAKPGVLCYDGYAQNFSMGERTVAPRPDSLRWPKTTRGKLIPKGRPSPYETV